MSKPTDDKISQIELPNSSQPALAPENDRDYKTSAQTQEPKHLTLHFSKEGVSLKFQTEDEINANPTFVSLEEPVSEPVSFLVDYNDPSPAPAREGLARSKTYDHILNDPVMNQLILDYESRSPDERRLQDLIIDKIIRDGHRRKTAKLRDVNLQFAIGENNYKNADFQAYLAQVTKELEMEGLWREESAEALESDVFAIDDIRDEDLDEDFEPRELHQIYNPKKMSMAIDSLKELEEQGLEWQDKLSLTPSDLPEFTTPTAHSLLRRAPWGLYETIARKLVEGSFFSNHPEIDDLFPCAYFVSKSIFTRELFIQVKYEAFARTPLQKRFRTYPYRKYLSDQKTLEKLTNEALKKYFHANPYVRANVDELTEGDSRESKKILDSIWSHFFEAQRGLTKKQKKALDAIYVQMPALTYDEAAKKEKISKDSFQDRVRGAVKKIKDALPELENLKASKTFYKSKEMRMLYNGLYCKDSAKVIHPVYFVDEDSDRKIEVPHRQGPPIQRAEAPNRVLIRAWSIVSTPVPDIMFTEFYTGLIPEAHILRKTGKSKFRG